MDSDKVQVSSSSSSPARACSCDIYAICYLRCPDEGKPGYCGIRDPVTGDELWRMERDGVVGCAISPISNRVAVVYHKPIGTTKTLEVRIIVWDLFSGGETLSVAGNVEYDLFCEFSQNGDRLISWNYRPQGICVRDIVSGAVLFSLLEQGGWPCFVGDAAGNSIAVQRGDSIRVLDIDSGNEISCLATGVGQHFIRRPVPSSDGRLCAVHSSTKFGVWEVSTGKALFQQTGLTISGVCIGGAGDLVIVRWARRFSEPRTLACFRIPDGSVVFEVETLFDANCMSVYSPLRSSFFLDEVTPTFMRLMRRLVPQLPSHNL
jgi:hypothetical protein